MAKDSVLSPIPRSQVAKRPRRLKSANAATGAARIADDPNRFPEPTILHASFDGARLMVWAETRAELALAAHAPGSNCRDGGERSPYDPGGRAVIAALERGGLTSADLRVQRSVVWLPSIAHVPIASSGLVADLPVRAEEAVLRPWRVDAVVVAWLAAIELLCVCSGRRTLAPGVIVSDDLSYWSAAIRLAAAIVARQHFLPDIVEEEGALVARWRPAPTYAGAQAIAQLAAVMPDACRAIGHADRSPDASQSEVLSAFIERVVDQLARSAEPTVARTSFDSIDARWLHALASPDPVLHGERQAVDQLRQRVQAWWRPVALAAASPFRMCLRLEEPEAALSDTAEQVLYDDTKPDNPWRLRYLLQAYDDPSLLVPASKAWSARGREADPFRRGGFEVREFLLQSLAQAARICPPIEQSLRGGIPDAHALDAEGAARFLTEQAGILEQAGFGIILPASWSTKGTKLRLTTRAKVKSPAMSSKAGLSLADLVEVNWEAALGDQPLSPEELRTLARLKTPLVKMRGQWVLLNAQEIREAIARLQRGTQKISAREALTMALGGVNTDGVDGGPVAVEGWMAELIERLSARERIEELAPPAGFSGSLRPYQQRGYSWLGFLRRWALGACLADDMGLGKTIQTLVHILHDRQQGAEGPVLLVCPTSVISNWQHEAARFTPGLRVLVHHGTGRARQTLTDSFKAYDIVLTSYSLLQRDAAALAPVAWSGVVLDEAQNIKNPESKQARAARTLNSDYRIALTGTPVENHVGDLWSLMEFLNPGLLSNRTEFKRRFLVPIQASNDQRAAQRLKSLTGPFILRRLKTDRTVIADLPEKLEMTVFCTLTQEQASLYAAVVEQALPQLENAEGIDRKGLVLATLSRLKQVCNHPAQFLGDNSAIPGRSGKLTRLAEMIEEVIESGERALIFSQFAEMGDIIRRHLEALFGREVLFLHGGVPKLRRDQMVARFQQAEAGGPAVFVLSLKAGGTGLNLTAASHVFHFDRWWNPAVENQATDRAFRIGQRRRVLVHKFLCVGTLEEKIDAIIEKKKALAESVIGTGEEWLTKLTTAELRDLLALRAEAVA